MQNKDTSVNSRYGFMRYEIMNHSKYCSRCDTKRDSTSSQICPCTKCIVCVRWFIDIDHHECEGGHCDDCGCFILNMKDHHCPLRGKEGEEGEEEEDMKLSECWECKTIKSDRHMHIWKEKKLCTMCYSSPSYEFERNHVMTLVRGGFYCRLPQCSSCDTMIRYSWDLEHYIKKIVDQGEEELAQSTIDDQIHHYLCLVCFVDKYQYLYGDDTEWTCMGTCQRRYPSNLLMDGDTMKRQFAGKSYCIHCYTSDKDIGVAKRIMKQVACQWLSSECTGCQGTIDHHRQLKQVYRLDRLFGLSLCDLVNRGDVLGMTRSMHGIRELCASCWTNLHNVEDILGITDDRRHIHMARTRRTFHPDYHPDIEDIITKYETELQKTKRYQVFQDNFNEKRIKE